MQQVYTEILGNLSQPEWHQKVMHDPDARLENVVLDQWTAQKSRFVARSDAGRDCAVALARRTKVADGDILAWDPDTHTATVIRLDLNPVLVVDLSRLVEKDPATIVRTALELGHAIGNQHWPAVVKDSKVYVPLTVDKKVMLGVMDTHHFEDITYTFEPGMSVIPFMAPHEARRLFGGANHESHALHHHHH